MLLLKAGLRYLLRHPWQLALSVLGVALGVAVVVAVDLVNASAERAFVHSTQTLAGQATHQVIGGPAGLPEELYVRLRLEHGVRELAPVVEGYAQLGGDPATTYTVLGVDVFADLAFRGYLSALDAGGPLESFLTRPGAVALDAATADRLGLTPGDGLSLLAGGRRHDAQLVATVQPVGELQRAALASVIITDIASAQELLGQRGRLTRIDLLAPEGAGGDALLARVADALPAGAQILPVGTRAHAMAQMTRAFRLNLTALSLLALVVGMFLIFNIMTFSVVRRRGQIGTLRALGVTRREVFGLVSGEALVIGVVGTAFGMAGGILLGDALLGLVTRTINDLYFVLDVRELTLAPGSLAKGIALGVGATLLAALAPAREATGAPPRAVLSRAYLEARLKTHSRGAALAGLAVLALAGLSLWLPGHSLLIGFAGLFALIAGFALLVPALTLLAVRLLRPLAAALFRAPGNMAARAIAASLSRTAPAIAALAIALSATVGVAVMVDSFRGTVERWLEGTLRADLYVTGAGPQAALDPGLAARLAQLPQVAAVSTGRRVDIVGPDGLTELFVLDIPPASFAAYTLKAGDPQRARAAFFAGEGVLVSEAFAWHHRLAVGDALELHSDRGPRRFPVVGVYYDYGSDRGVVSIARTAYERYWDDRTIGSFGIYAAPGADLAELERRVRGQAGEGQGLVVQSNARLREASMEIFDQTFAITHVLRLIAILVAVVGILSALLALQLERARELAVLRATGMTPGQVWGMVSVETGLMGAIAGALAVPLGATMAWMLVEVINRRSFGWSMELVLDPAIAAQAVLLAMAAALAAGLYPARRMARTSPAAALREE